MTQPHPAVQRNVAIRHSARCSWTRYSDLGVWRRYALRRQGVVRPARQRTRRLDLVRREPLPFPPEPFAPSASASPSTPAPRRTAPWTRSRLHGASGAGRKAADRHAATQAQRGALHLPSGTCRAAHPPTPRKRHGAPDSAPGRAPARWPGGSQRAGALKFARSSCVGRDFGMVGPAPCARFGLDGRDSDTGNEIPQVYQAAKPRLATYS